MRAPLGHGDISRTFPQALSAVKFGADKMSFTRYLALDSGTLLGYGDLAEPVPITVTHINTLGYPSLPVDAMLLPGSADGGCSIGGTGPTSALLVILALASTRLRRRDRCVGRRS